MARLVVVGSLNMDLMVKVEKLPSRGETAAARQFQTSPGGKGGNQSVAAARLGASVTMVGRVGRDSFGEALLSNLESNNVDTSNIVRDPDSPTGMALITVDDDGANTIVVAQGANGKCNPRDVYAAEGVISRAKVLVVQFEIPLETVEAALEIARRYSVMTILNPAPARRVPEDILSYVDILIPNEVEAACLCGCPVESPDNAVAAAEKILGMGPERVIVTLGERGAVFAGPEGKLHVPAFPVKAVDSTGAGDAFIAAFAVGWANGIDIERNLRYACAAGALATTRVGAQAASPSASELEEAMGELLSGKIPSGHFLERKG